MRKFLKCFVVAAIMLTVIPFNVHAASGSAYLSGSSSVRAGNTTTIRLGFNGSDKVAGVQYTIAASGSLEIVSISGLNGVNVNQTGNNVIQAVFATEGLNSGSAWADIVVKVPNGSKVGSKGTLTISNIGMSLDNNPSTLYANNVSKTITVASTPSQNQNPTTPVVKSSDATLRSLVLKNVNDFKFNKDIFEYTINVGYEVTSLDLTATTNDPKASYVVKGNENFVVGSNLVTITVTAEDGTVKDYKLNVIRAEKTVEKEECPKCDTTDGNEKLIWIIISTILAVLLIAETGYVVYDKQRNN